MVGSVVGCGSAWLWVSGGCGSAWLWVVGCGLAWLWVVGYGSVWLGRGRGSASWDEASRWSWIGG